MKRVLFLAYLFPPIANSGTQRSLKFAKYLVDHGWAPTVLTASESHGHPTDPDLLEELPAAVRIVRVPMLSEHIGQTVSSVLGSGRVAQRIGDGLRWRLQNYRRPPDFHSWWQPTAFRAAMRLHQATRFDAIFATGYPWTSLLTGCAVSKAAGIPLVADFRDLWAGEHLFREQRPSPAEELALEHSVVEHASGVVTASAAIACHLAAAHPDVDRGKFVTVHNGFDPDDFTVAPHPRTPGRPFRIVFTGAWKDDYNPGELYDTIDWIRRSSPGTLDGVQVIAAGFAPGEARRRGLDQYIDERGVVPHLDAVALMRSADLLYLTHVDRDRQWAVPGKLYDYLASGAPVFAVTYPGQETAQIMAAAGGGLVFSPDDQAGMRRALADACRLRSFVAPPLDAGALAAFERRSLTGKLASVLDDACGQTTRRRRAG